MLHMGDSRDMYDGAESRGSMGTAHGPSATAPTRARTAEIAGPVAAAAATGPVAVAAAAEMGLAAHCFGFAL